MVKTFKNLNKGALVALAVAGFFAISWTTAAHKLAPQWYQVSLIDENGNPNDANNQRIDGAYPGGSPTSPCNQSLGHKCATFMDIGSNPLPSTVAEANALGIAQQDSSFRTP